MGNLYTKYKIFNYHEKVESLAKHNDKITPPIHIRIKPTNACNHHCWYCAYRVDDLQLGQDMILKDMIPADKMMEIIDDIHSMGVKAVTFSGGGEPLYYPHIIPAVRKLVDYRIGLATLTNGARLDGELAELFSEYGTWVRISMDGWDDASYRKYRGCKDGEYTKIINNIKHFIQLGGKCLMGVSLILDKDNVTHVREQMEIMKSIGVHSVKLGAAIVSNNSRESNLYHQPFFEKTKEVIQRAKEDLADDSFEVFDAYHQLEENFDKDYDWCPYLQILPVIGADLNIYSCQDKAYNLDSGLLGSIKDCSFKDFWFNSKEKFFKIKPNQVCSHHCVANNKNKMLIEYLDADPDHIGFV